MLGSLRDAAKTGWLKYILLGLLVLAGGGLVLTDVGGFFRGGISTNLVAKGSGIEVSTAQFDRNVRRILARQGMSPQEAYQLGMINQILNSEIQVLILTKEARKLGVNVSDDTVRQQISKLAEPLAAEGTSKTEALKQILRSQGVSEGEFVQSIRQEMGNTLFRNALLSGVSGISKQEAAALYKYRNENRDFSGFILSNNSVKDITAPTDENIQKYYDANKNDFAIAEKRSITIATLKKEMLADKITITEDDLRDVYADTIDRYKLPERRKLQQAILNTQSDAQEVFKKVTENKDLKKAVNDVTGKTSAFLGENDFEQSGLLEEIAKPVFEAESGAIIGPVQTALGWHVLILKEIIQPQTEPFEKVKAAIKDDIMQTKLLDDLVDAANTLDDQLAGGEKLDVVVKEMGLTTEAFTDFNQAGTDDKGKDLFAGYQGDKAQILEAAFDYDTGESSPVLEMADGRYVTVRVDAIQPLSYQSFDSVKAKLKDRWVNEQKDLTNRARAAEAFEKLKGGASIADIAKEYGVSVQKFSAITRTATPKDPLTLPMVRTIFDADKDLALKLDGENEYIIGEVTNIALPTDKIDEDTIAKIQAETAELLPQEILSQYINSLAEKYKVKINDRVLQIVYGASTDS